MELILSSEGVERLTRTLECLTNQSLATALWRVDCARALGALAESTHTSVVVLTPAVRALVAAEAEATTSRFGERRRRSAGVWVRSPGDGAASSALGMTARTATDETVVSVVCEYDPPLDQAEARRRLEPFRIVFPVFNAMVRRRFGHRGEDVALHPLLSASVRHLLDAVPDGVACLDDEGQMVWRNAALDRLFAADDDSERLRRELTTATQGLAIRAWGQRHGHLDDPEPAMIGGEFHTQRRRYWLRLVRAEDGGNAIVVAIVTRLGMPPSDEALTTLRTRFRLTKREVEVARMLLDGRRNAEVAHALNISPHTARHHTERLLSKLGLESRNDIFFLVAARRSGEMRIPTTETERREQ